MNRPTPEARIAAQEELTALLHAQIKQLSLDTQANFTEVKQDIKQLDEGIKASYVSIGDTFIATWDDIKATLATKEDVSDIKTTMATKDDISKVHSRFDKVEGDIARLEGLIMQLLQQKGE